MSPDRAADPCALTIDLHRELVVNAITERLCNARLEDMNSTVRLLSDRARGYRWLTSLLAMLTLVSGRIPVALPSEYPKSPKGP